MFDRRHFVRIVTLFAVAPTRLLAALRSAAASEIAPPQTTAGDALAWSLDIVNRDADTLTTDELQTRFAPAFLAGLPPADLAAVFRTYLSPNAPMTIARFEGPTDGPRLKALLSSPIGAWRVTIGVEPTTALIDELFFEPVYLPALPAKPPKTWAAFDTQFAKIAPKRSFMAAEIVDGAIVPIHGYRDDTSLAIGSNFKLYVLGALGAAIADGRTSWDDPIVITDDLRSLPSGDLFRQPAGAVFPVRYVAEQMISISDNTGSDHLIGLLGREQVEAMQTPMGHHDPSLNEPFLLTREWFAIKLRFTAKQVVRYLAASENGRREILANEADPAAATLSEVDDWPGPYLIDTIEWFASAADLCRALTYLQTQASQSGLEEIGAALSIEPGYPFDPDVWRYVGYKGGYETGVKSDAWLLQRQDGRWFALAAIINNPKAEIDGYDLASLSLAAVNLLAKSE